MKLLHFGPSSRPLFGMYRTPPANVPTRGAALLCSAWGQEYLVSHRLYRRIALQLSEIGYHVLRFDYFGTGDSSGTREDGDLTSWQKDANLALDELRDMSGIEAVAVLGVRLGARVAWRLATQRADVHTAILWDPIIDGRAYVAELIESQRDVDRRSLAPRARQAATSGEVHVNGFPLTVAMRRDIEALQLPEFATETRAAVTLFFSEEASGGALLSDTLRSAGTSVQVEVMPGQTPWGDEVAIGSSSVPIRVVTRLVETLG